MFGFFKTDPAKKLKAEYNKLLEEARDLQRKGDIKGYAHKTAEAEALLEKIESLKSA
jgi:hypothetical protein